MQLFDDAGVHVAIKRQNLTGDLYSRGFSRERCLTLGEALLIHLPLYKWIKVGLFPLFPQALVSFQTWLWTFRIALRLDMADISLEA